MLSQIWLGSVLGPCLEFVGYFHVTVEVVVVLVPDCGMCGLWFGINTFHDGVKRKSINCVPAKLKEALPFGWIGRVAILLFAEKPNVGIWAGFW